MLSSSAQSLSHVGLFVTLKTVATRLLCPMDSQTVEWVAVVGIWDQIKDKMMFYTVKPSLSLPSYEMHLNREAN